MASPAICDTVMGAAAGWLFPIPRLSNDTHVKRDANASTCGRQPPPATPTPWMKSTAGPEPLTE